MTNKEAIEKLKEILFMTGYSEALELAIKALETLDDVNHKIYRNEYCPQKNRCYDYQGYHCAGCNWGVKNNGQI